MTVFLNPRPCPSTAQGFIRTITPSGRPTVSDLSKVAEWTAEPASSFLAGATWAAVGAPPGGGTLKGPHHSPPAVASQEGASPQGHLVASGGSFDHQNLGVRGSWQPVIVEVEVRGVTRCAEQGLLSRECSQHQVKRLRPR